MGHEGETLVEEFKMKTHPPLAHYTKVRRTLIRAYGPDLPDGYALTSASLFLYQDNVPGTNQSVYLYRMLTAWKETEASWYSNSLTTVWGAAGLLSGTDYLPASKVTAQTPAAVGLTVFNVTADMQDFIGGSAPNRGWFICLSNESAAVRFRAAHKDNIVSQRPYVVYEFEPAEVPGLVQTNWITADTQLHSANPTNAYGADTAMHVGLLSGSPVRSLIYVPVTGLSPNTTVRSARLRCYQDDVQSPTIDDIVGAYRLLVPWNELTATWQSNTVSSSWSVPGTGSGDRQLTSTDTSYVSSTTAQYVDFDVTQDVQAFVSGSAANYGWVLINEAEGGTSVARFRTRHYGIAVQRPSLIIRYTKPTGTAIMVF